MTTVETILTPNLPPTEALPPSEFQVGPFTINVTALPGPQMTNSFWSKIQTARDSYEKHWGGNHATKQIKEDPFDGLDKQSPYNAVHFLSTITDSKTRHEKTITMRYVSLNKHAGTDTPLPDDITFWQVSEGDNPPTPLWNHIQKHLKSRNQTKNPRYNIAAISRTGAFETIPDKPSPHSKDMSALAFAAIQIVTTNSPDHQLLACQLCPEFQQSILSLIDVNGRAVMLDFTPASIQLGLPDTAVVALDNNNPHVQEHKTSFPGYWVNNQDALKLLRILHNSPQLDASVYEKALQDLSSEYPNIQIPTDLNDLLTLLTSPRFFKFLIPLIKQQGPITPSLEGQAFRNMLIYQTGDGPFASLIRPSAWNQSAKQLIDAAQAKYSQL